MSPWFWLPITAACFTGAILLKLFILWLLAR